MAEPLPTKDFDVITDRPIHTQSIWDIPLGPEVNRLLKTHTYEELEKAYWNVNYRLMNFGTQDEIIIKRMFSGKADVGDIINIKLPIGYIMRVGVKMPLPEELSGVPDCLEKSLRRTSDAEKISSYPPEKMK